MLLLAGQGEIGQHELAGNSLLPEFSSQAFNTVKTQREKFAQLQDVIRRCSDNFQPEEFDRRIQEEMARGWSPKENLEMMMKCTAKALKALNDHVDVMEKTYLYSEKEIQGYRDVIEQETKMKTEADKLYTEWLSSQNVTSQLEHNAV